MSNSGSSSQQFQQQQQSQQQHQHQIQQQQHSVELRRSNKMQDFSGLNRERSFVRAQNNHHHHHLGRNDKKRSHTSMVLNMRGVRLDGSSGQNGLQNPKLNVHAKEFTMNHNSNLQTSRSSANLTHNFLQQNILQHQHQLQHSKSSGDMLRHMHHQNLLSATGQQPGPPPSASLIHHHPQQSQIILPASGIPLLQSASSGNILHSSQRVHFHPAPMTPQPTVSGQQAFFPITTNSAAIYRPLRQPFNIQNQAPLKRSKSLSAADSLASKLQALNITSEAPDLGQFSPEIEELLAVAVDDPNKLSGRCLMDLVKTILERILDGRRYSLPGAKLCLTIIEKEKNETFLETLLNTCQQWYQDRDKILRNIKTGEGSRFTAFMWFLTEMSSQLKRRQLQLKTQCEGVTPGIVLLSLLVKCCQACVQPPKSLAEIECLFFVLTSIGRDLEAELPAQLGQLLESVRDGFLASTAAPQIRKTLLQLIELKASNWQLPGSTVLYYYPKMK